MRWLAYVHPAAMAAVLGLGLLVLREGLRLRRARLLGPSLDSARHRRLAQVFVALIVVGYGSGLLSMGRLRAEPLFDSVHAIFTTGALVGFVLAFALGKQLQHRPGSALRTVHVACGAVGLLLGLAAAVAGIAILP
jgi:hypothetical protein